MKIAFVGYGKMGHMLESTAIALGHESAVTVDVFAKDAKVIVPEGDADDKHKGPFALAASPCGWNYRLERQG